MKPKAEVATLLGEFDLAVGRQRVEIVDFTQAGKCYVCRRGMHIAAHVFYFGE